MLPKDEKENHALSRVVQNRRGEGRREGGSDVKSSWQEIRKVAKTHKSKGKGEKKK